MKIENELILHFQVNKLDLLFGKVSDQEIAEAQEKQVYCNRPLKRIDTFNPHRCAKGTWSLTVVPPKKGESDPTLLFQSGVEKSEVERFELETSKHQQGWVRLDRIFIRDPEFWRGESFPFTFQHRHLQVESNSNWKWDIIFCQTPGMIFLDGEVVWSRAYPAVVKIDSCDQVTEIKISSYLIGVSPYYDLHGWTFKD